MQKIEYTKYFFMLLILVILYVSFLLIKPFITTLVISIILAYAFFPLYKILEKRIKRKNLTSFIMTLLVLALIILPIGLTINTITKEMAVAFVSAKQRIATGNILSIDCDSSENFLCRTTDSVKKYTSDPQISSYLEDSLKTVTTSLTKKISDFVLSIPSKILDVFIMFFALFYLFRDGKKGVQKLKSLLPVKPAYKERIINRLNGVMYAVVYVYILVAIVQGILGGLGFLFVGISSPILWGFIMALFSLLPIGSIVIWLPAAIFLIVNGYLQNTNSLIFKGIFLIIYGIIIVGFSDNVIRLRIIGAKANIHPVLIVLGVVGGLLAFGFIGTVIGPLILALLVTFMEIYEKER